MLIFDFRTVCNKWFSIRKQSGLTQVEVAKATGLSERIYADIERGTVNMRTETILRICKTLHITPEEILTEDTPLIEFKLQEITERLSKCSEKDQEFALRMLSIFLQALHWFLTDLTIKQEYFERSCHSYTRSIRRTI